MKIKETVLKNYVCDFCNLSASIPEYMEFHEKECYNNPESAKFIKSETKRVKQKLIGLVYDSFKDDNDFKTLISIKDGNYANDFKYIIHNKLSLTIRLLSNANNIHIPNKVYRKTHDQIENAVIKKLGEKTYDDCIHDKFVSNVKCNDEINPEDDILICKRG
jgi:hypothetical protein